jgi:hypothetical protein
MFFLLQITLMLWMNWNVFEYAWSLYLLIPMNLRIHSWNRLLLYIHSYLHESFLLRIVFLGMTYTCLCTNPNSFSFLYTLNIRLCILWSNAETFYGYHGLETALLEHQNMSIPSFFSPLRWMQVIMGWSLSKVPLPLLGLSPLRLDIFFQILLSLAMIRFAFQTCLDIEFICFNYSSKFNSI